ncbi:MAG TPA: hypothetical protein VG754_01515 [Verrucomicrobiae bacterium]|nr:hypothetical protein [Verrucomicrobiae bacterium]
MSGGSGTFDVQRSALVVRCFPHWAAVSLGGQTMLFSSILRYSITPMSPIGVLAYLRLNKKNLRNTSQNDQNDNTAKTLCLLFTFMGFGLN